VTAGTDISYLLKCAIPDALEPIIKTLVGKVIPRGGEGDRYRIAYFGAFSSRVAADLLAFGRNQRLDGALILIDDDVLRALYYRQGRVVGGDSNVLFERLGRVLLRAALVDDATASALISAEEASGVGAATAVLPADVARFGLERRTWDIAAGLFLIHRGNFLILEGAPDLGAVEALDLSPMDLAIEGLRRYDEWRNGAAGVPIPVRKAPEKRPPEAPATPGTPATVRKPTVRSAASAADEILRQLRDEG
jgi:hypothetical protein